MPIFSLILVIVGAILYVCASAMLQHFIQGERKRLKAYAANIQDIALQQANQIEVLTWERNAAHMMVEHLVKMVPEFEKDNNT